ncbi:MAG: hypothetical protein RI897_1929 [Verrucomicrobiota bacterium]
MIARWICCQHPVPAAVAQPRVGYDSRLAGVADLSHVGLMQEAVVRARIESRLKQDAEVVFAKPGISTTEAIRMFLSQVCLRRGLPFALSLPEKDDL